MNGVFVSTSAHQVLIARQLDRLPATEESEVQTMYRCRGVCRSHGEAHIRALVVQAISRDEFVLRAVRSGDLDRGSDLVEVEAELQRFGRDEVAL
jgi:putative Mg2+ transporter-C (MgtC) family protein